jgi:hypothetical protein
MMYLLVAYSLTDFNLLHSLIGRNTTKFLGKSIVLKHLSKYSTFEQIVLTIFILMLIGADVTTIVSLILDLQKIG